VLGLAADPPGVVDYFIGSVHHTHSVPIDYDAASYARAVAASSRGGTEEGLYEDYYDLQHEMLKALEPRVVGHFDLVRLMSSQPGRDIREWKGVWEKVRRNLELVKEQGGMLECNSSALRKGLDEPYPCRAIAEEWLRLGGKFTMSDDSHGIGQVATNYARALSFLESLGVKELWTFRRTPHPGIEGTQKATLESVSVPLADFQAQFP
jgi:histidinol-phosphatase (PHP family)